LLLVLAQLVVLVLVLAWVLVLVLVLVLLLGTMCSLAAATDSTTSTRPAWPMQWAPATSWCR
jgi:hypothetical protein